eukprot:479597_1
MSYDFLFRYVIVGDAGTGKTKLLIQFALREYYRRECTIGIEFEVKLIKINNEKIKLQCWDTVGQESFRSITRSYYRDAACALLVYDITNRNTFLHVQDWLNELKSFSANDQIVIMIVGNKSDLVHQRQVTYKEGETFAKQNGLLFIETSAKLLINVDDAFIIPANEIYWNIHRYSYSQNDALVDGYIRRCYHQNWTEGTIDMNYYPKDICIMIVSWLGVYDIDNLKGVREGLYRHMLANELEVLQKSDKKCCQIL